MTIGERAEDVFYVCLESGGGAGRTATRQLGEALLEHLDSSADNTKSENMQELEQIIEHAFDNRAQGFDDRAQVEAAVQEAIACSIRAKRAWRKRKTATGTSTSGSRKPCC